MLFFCLCDFLVIFLYCLYTVCMNLQQCKDALLQQYRGDSFGADNLSSFTRKAWWSDQSDCLREFGSSTAISQYIEQVRQNTTDYVQGDDLDWWTNWSEHEWQTSTVTQWFNFFDNAWESVGDYVIQWLRIVLYLFIAFFLYKFIKYLLIFLYDVYNAKRIVYLKVLQTRGDSKVDRDVQKELAKDMKEKISRMSQIYKNFHKLWELNSMDNIMRYLFHKPKVTLILQYEEGKLNFIFWVYPEYQQIVEGAISAQFSSASIETIPKPKFFWKKYNEIIPMQSTQESVYTIKMFKQMPDDPINNIVDALGKVSRYDTFSVVMPMKPVGTRFNKRAKAFSTALYKRDKKALRKTARRKYVLFPWKILDFFVNGPDKALFQWTKDDGQGDHMIRMVKSQEDSYNAMGEEASNPAFAAWILLVTSSDVKENPKNNISNMVSTYSIYEDSYTNSLDQSERLADFFGFFFKPLWRFAAMFHLPDFFYSKNILGLNEITSLFHLPDGTYNRSPIITWMDYKVLPWPDNLPKFAESNGFVMSGVVAENFKWWKLTNILANSPHRAVAKKNITKDTLVPIEKLTQKQIGDKEIVEKKNGKKYVKNHHEETVRWYKMYNDWVLLWINIYRNKYSPVYMKRNDRTRHHYCVGKSGTWKSVYLQSIARQDIRNGDWCCIIDPHGDLAEDMLEYIPKERAKDVIFFDAWNEDRPMGLNLYEIDHPDQADRTVNDATEIFLKMFWSEIFGPRIQEYFKYGSLTLLEDFEDKPTLLDVPRLFTDETYREFKIKRVKNPVVKNFREKTYNAMGDREKQEIIPYFTSKFVSFNTNRLIRNIIGQTKSAFNFKDAMDNRKIVLVSLSKGKIGELNAQLLGMIMVSQIYNAAMSRASMAKEDRKDFYLYVDEFQNFVSWTFADILSEARKYRLCLIMAHQYIAQLESWNKSEWGKADVKAAVFGNVGTLQSFKVGAPDAEFLEKEYAPVLWAQDIVWIANYKAYIKLNIDNATTRVFSMNAIYTQDYRNKKIAAILKEYSAKKYGRKRVFVDAEIAARLWLWNHEEWGGDAWKDWWQQPWSDQLPIQPLSEGDATPVS